MVETRAPGTEQILQRVGWDAPELGKKGGGLGLGWLFQRGASPWLGGRRRCKGFGNEGCPVSNPSLNLSWNQGPWSSPVHQASSNTTHVAEFAPFPWNQGPWSAPPSTRPAPVGGLAGQGWYPPTRLGGPGVQGGGARARGGCKGFGSGGVGGRDTGPRDNVCAVSNTYKKRRKMAFF